MVLIKISIRVHNYCTVTGIGIQSALIPNAWIWDIQRLKVMNGMLYIFLILGGHGSNGIYKADHRQINCCGSHLQDAVNLASLYHAHIS